MLRSLRLSALVLCFLAFVARADVSLPDFERVELDNGVVLLISEKHDVPLVGLEATIRGGATQDPEGLNGLANLLAGMLEKGAGERDAATFAETVDAVGGRLSASSGLESLRLSADFMARDSELLIELLTDMLRRPTLDEAEFEKLRDRSINLIKAAKGSDPGNLLPHYGNAFLFADHPYGNPVGGSEESLARITHEDLLAFYEDHVGADRLIISVVGDFNAEAMKNRLAAAFGDWRSAAAEAAVVPAAPRVSGRRVLLVDKPGATQTYIWLGNVGVAVDYPSRAELNLANTVFGGRFTSMLNNELRVKAGLTYSARSVLTRPALPGSVVIRTFTETSTTIEAIDMALELLEELRESGIDDEMIESARNYVMGQFPPRLETAAQLAPQLGMLELYGLDAGYVDNYVEALTAANAEGIATTINDVYPAPDDLVFVLIGDAGEIRDAVSQYGPLTEMSIQEMRFRP